MKYVRNLALAVLLLASAAAVQAQPTFPAQGMVAINTLYAGVNPQDDVARRIAIKRVCEQMQFDLGEQWGNKKRTGLSDDFLSPDSIAFQEAPGQPVSVWDVQASSGAILVHEGKAADHPNLPLDEATFMDCTATDHIGGTPDPDPDPEPEPDPALEARVSALEALAAQIRANLDAFVAQFQALVGRVTVLESRPLPPISCRASIFGIPLSCTLVPAQ